MANRIEYALYMEGWSFEEGDENVLVQHAQRVLPSEYQEVMGSHIYCPVCFTNLSRSPKGKALFSNNRSARYNHLPRYVEVDCPLRTKQTTGKLYPNVELARQAIESGELAIIDSFVMDSPEQVVPDENQIYDDVHVDQAGPTVAVPLSSHNGESFEVPSKITTVAGICRGFDRNLYKYYLLPGSSSAFLLQSLLIDIRSVQDVDETPRLYWGIVESSTAMGAEDWNLRMTKLYCHRRAIDFHIKAVRSEQERKGINDQSQDKIVIFWGAITRNGIGLCVERPGWGEYALLPTQYKNLLLD